MVPGAAAAMPVGLETADPASFTGQRFCAMRFGTIGNFLITPVADSCTYDRTLLDNDTTFCYNSKETPLSF